MVADDTLVISAGARYGMEPAIPIFMPDCTRKLPFEVLLLADPGFLPLSLHGAQA
jgi:hypothetical protein